MKLREGKVFTRVYLSAGLGVGISGTMSFPGGVSISGTRSLLG